MEERAAALVRRGLGPPGGRRIAEPPGSEEPGHSRKQTVAEPPGDLWKEGTNGDRRLTQLI